MPPPSFFTRARRIFQNATQQPPQSDHPHIGPTDANDQSQYETDGSSYEMLVVESPSKPRQVSQKPSQSEQKHQQKPPEQNSKQRQPKPQEQKHTNKQQLEPQPKQQPEPQPKQQPEPQPKRQPEPQPKQRPEQRTPPPLSPSEPATPSQKLPVALRRIDATPTKLPDTPGYNLRPRTRSQATPSRQKRLTPARSRRRELRHAPSARTTSGVAARPAIVSRREIDESSYVTLRALCRNFGLPTSGTKAELRARAIGKFEGHRVLDEQTQPLDNEPKLEEDSRGACPGVLPSKDNGSTKKETEENSGPVPQGAQTKAAGEEPLGESEEEAGKQLTTSTVKPAGHAKQLPLEAAIHGKSDEPSVHAKSDAPQNDPRPPSVNPAECSTANSPTPAATQRAHKIAQPTVSSTGVAVNTPDSPRPPPPHPTPRLSDPPLSFPIPRCPDGPTESVDARGGDVDVAAIFQGLAAGRQKLSSAEYEAALRALKENAPDRPQPLQIPINAARVSLNILPTPSPLNFKPPQARVAAVISGVIPIPSQTNSPVLLNNLGVASGRAVPSSSAPDKAGTGSEHAVEKSDQEGTSAPKPTRVASATAASATGALPLVEKVKAEVTGEGKPVPSEKGHGRGDEGVNVNSNRSKEKPAVESRSARDTKRGIMETPPQPEPNRNETELESKLAELNQTPLPAIFEGARGGPHEGNIVDAREVRTPVPNLEATPAKSNGDKALDAERDKCGKDTQADLEVTRSGFATPRELVRRFNRFRSAHLSGDEDTPLKPCDDGDPTTSLRRRNARRSSSGVPLFYSARGPTTTGRSIFKARTSSRAREAQEHLRRIDRMHNLSGRASFRVKRPLSASAGALLVDLRRTSGPGGAPVERMDQRGSFQAEVARRPPPMAASALKILNNLQKIQEENRANASRKRAISPPPLPPSVLKRARHSGQFAITEGPTDKTHPARGQNEAGPLKKDSGRSLFELDTSSGPKDSEFLVPFGRQTPKIPLVAYGAGKRRSKKSRTSRLASAALSAIENQVDEDTEKGDATDKEERADIAGAVASTKRRRHGQDAPNMKEDVQHDMSLDKTKEIPMRGTKAAILPTFDTQDRAEGTLFPKAQQRDTSVVPANFAKPSGGALFKLPQQHGVEQRAVSAYPANNLLKTGVGVPPIARKIDSADMKETADNKFLQRLPQTASDISVFDKQKFPARTIGTNRSTATEEKKSSTFLEQEKGNRSPPRKDSAVAGVEVIAADMKRDMADSTRSCDKAKASQPQPQDIYVKSKTTPHSKGNGVQAPSGSSGPLFPESKAPVGSSLGFPASPFVRPIKSFSAEGQKGNLEEDKSAETRQAGIPVPSKTVPSFGSFGGTKGSAGVVSAPSITNDERGSGAHLAFGVSPFREPIQPETELQVREKELSSSLPEKDSAAEKESIAAPLASERVPAVPVVPPQSKESDVPSTKEEVQGSGKTEPGRPSEDHANVVATPSIKLGFGGQLDGKPEALPPSKAFAPPSETDEPSAVTKSQVPPNSTVIMAASTAPLPATAFKFGEKSAVPTTSQTDGVLAASDKQASPFASGPFSKPVEQKELKRAFSFSATPNAPSRTPGGPFADTHFKPTFSSSSSGSMFVFGSSTGSAAAVKPAPSIGVLGKSATPDGAKSNPFAQPASTAPFGSQPAAELDAMTPNSGPTFGMSSSAAPSVTFGPLEAKATSGFGSSFGSSPALFKAGTNTSFAAASTTPAFGGSSESTTPMFGSAHIPSTPFGASSGPTVAPTFGAPSSGPASSGMFGASSGGTSTAELGGAASGSFAFGSSNVSTFGASNNQPNPFSQNGNLPSMTSAGMFGTAQPGVFNMGSATRPPPTQRRRLRGRRTLR